MKLRADNVIKSFESCEVCTYTNNIRLVIYSQGVSYVSYFHIFRIVINIRLADPSGAINFANSTVIEFEE